MRTAYWFTARGPVEAGSQKGRTHPVRGWKGFKVWIARQFPIREILEIDTAWT
jgi:hypothetical protein